MPASRWHKLCHWRAQVRALTNAAEVRGPQSAHVAHPDPGGTSFSCVRLFATYRNPRQMQKAVQSFRSAWSATAHTKLGEETIIWGAESNPEQTP